MKWRESYEIRRAKMQSVRVTVTRVQKGDRVPMALTGHSFHMGKIPCEGYVIRTMEGETPALFVRDSDLLLAKESLTKTGVYATIVAQSWD